MGEGLFIDTTQHTGGDVNKIKVWSDFAIEHHREMKVLKGAGLLKPNHIDAKGEKWRNNSEHALVVGGLASYVAKLRKANIELAEIGGTLHDASKREDKEKKIGYATEQKVGGLTKLLADSGYTSEQIKISSYSGRVPEVYLSPDEQEKAIKEIPIESLIVAYSDARIRNTDIVSLEEARDKNKIKNPKDSAFYDQWYEFYNNVENYLFSAIDNVTPSDITNTSVFQYLQSNR